MGQELNSFEKCTKRKNETILRAVGPYRAFFWTPLMYILLIYNLYFLKYIEHNFGQSTGAINDLYVFYYAEDFEINKISLKIFKTSRNKFRIYFP